MTGLGVVVAGDVTVYQLPLIALTCGTAILLGAQADRQRRTAAELAATVTTTRLRGQHERSEAVATERSRIARELHDIIGHTLATIAVRAEAADRVASRRPDAARDAVGAIATAARSALDETRRVLAGLRTSTGADLGPPPDLDSIRRLVDDVADAGVTVALATTGCDDHVPPAVVVGGAHRIVQESLTNAVKHAGPGVHVRVALTCGPDWLEIVVIDDGANEAGGRSGGEPVDGGDERGPGVRVGRHGRAGRGVGGHVRRRSRTRRRVRGPSPAADGASVVIRVAIADDLEMLRTGLELIVDNEDDMTVVASVADGNEIVEVCRTRPVDVVLMDIRMPELDGLSATERILAEDDPPRIVILTTFGLDEYVSAAIVAGASGFLLKDAPAEALVTAVRSVAEGEIVLAPAVVRTVVDQARSRKPVHVVPGIDQLTDRELDVLQAMAAGYSNAEIATRLYLSEATIKTHVSRVLLKLAVRDRVQAVIAAFAAGVAEPDPSAIPERDPD